MAIRSPSHVPMTYSAEKGVRIVTPVCALARNDIPTTERYRIGQNPMVLVHHQPEGPPLSAVTDGKNPPVFTGGFPYFYRFFSTSSRNFQTRSVEAISRRSRVVWMSCI